MNAEWPADAVERRPVASLMTYAANARTHSAEQVAQIAASVQEWGWTTPVLVDEAGQIIAGHGRVLAAQKLGLTEVPVMVARGWSEAQKRAYVLADNKLALNAGWDLDLLRGELDGLNLDGFDLALTGFDAAELGKLSGADEGALVVHEVDTSDVADVFFVTVSGPLQDQADALHRIKTLMADMPQVEVDLGCVMRDAPR